MDKKVHVLVVNENEGPIVGILDNAVSNFPDTPLLLDLRTSRLSVLSLPSILAWLGVHPSVSMCVGQTNIGFSELCVKVLLQAGHLDLISSRRINLAYEQQELYLEKLHMNAFLEGRQMKLDEAVQQCSHLHRELEMVTKVFAKGAKDHAITTSKIDNQLLANAQGIGALNGWHRSLTGSYEILATAAMRMAIRKQQREEEEEHGDEEEEEQREEVGEKGRGSQIEIFEMPRRNHKINNFPPLFPRGVEWDGVLFVDPDLCLIEAKTSLMCKHIREMPERIKRTLEFIRLCKSGDLPPQKGVSVIDAQICRAWAGMTATSVFGVVGGNFTTDMEAAADEMGLIRIFPSDGAYVVTPPKGGLALDFLSSASVVRAMKELSVTDKEIQEVEAAEVESNRKVSGE